MNTKQIYDAAVAAYVHLKQELTNLSAERLALKMKMIDLNVGKMLANDTTGMAAEIKKNIEEANAGISRLIRKKTIASYYLSAAYGCEFCLTNHEEDQGSIAAANRIRDRLFAVLEHYSIYELPAISTDRTEEESSYYLDLVDLNNVYSRYFESLIVEPKLG